jgi:hypothetical protein
MTETMLHNSLVQDYMVKVELRQWKTSFIWEFIKKTFVLKNNIEFELTFYFYLFYFIIFSSGGGQTQGLTHARHVLYHWVTFLKVLKAKQQQQEKTHKIKKKILSSDILTFYCITDVNPLTALQHVVLFLR